MKWNKELELGMYEKPMARIYCTTPGKYCVYVNLMKYVSDKTVCILRNKVHHCSCNALVIKLCVLMAIIVVY